jgi:hypothetical protein
VYSVGLYVDAGKLGKVPGLGKLAPDDLAQVCETHFCYPGLQNDLVLHTKSVPH